MFQNCFRRSKPGYFIRIIYNLINQIFTHILLNKKKPMKLRHKKPLNSYKNESEISSSVNVQLFQEINEDDFHQKNITYRKLDVNDHQANKLARILVSFIKNINDDYKSLSLNTKQIQSSKMNRDLPTQFSTRGKNNKKNQLNFILYQKKQQESSKPKEIENLNIQNPPTEQKQINKKNKIQIDHKQIEKIKKTSIDPSTNNTVINHHFKTTENNNQTAKITSNNTTVFPNVKPLPKVPSYQTVPPKQHTPQSNEKSNVYYNPYRNINPYGMFDPNYYNTLLQQSLINNMNMMNNYTNPQMNNYTNPQMNNYTNPQMNNFTNPQLFTNLIMLQNGLMRQPQNIQSYQNQLMQNFKKMQVLQNQLNVVPKLKKMAPTEKQLFPKQMKQKRLFNRSTYHVSIAYMIHVRKLQEKGINLNDENANDMIDPTFKARTIREGKKMTDRSTIIGEDNTK